MNLRLLLWVFAPIFPVVDLLWFWGDEDRQMLSDRFAGTYVIRNGAIPIGEGPIRATTLFVIGSTVAFPEVQKIPAGGGSGAAVTGAGPAPALPTPDPPPGG